MNDEVGAVEPRGRAIRRLAFELSGCLSHAALTLPSKIDNVRDAMAHGWKVDVFCALEACNAEQEASAQSFIGSLNAELGANVVNCTWWPRGGGGLLHFNGTLRAEWLKFHARYPYDSHHIVGKMHSRSETTLSMLHKFNVLKRMRWRQPPYDGVWRSRPDTVVKNVSWSLVNSVVRHDGRYYVVPTSAWALGHHTDMDAILSEQAADRWGDAFYYVMPLHSCGVSFHPETLVHQNMAGGNFRCILDGERTLQFCRPKLLASGRRSTACSGATSVRAFDDPTFAATQSDLGYMPKIPWPAACATQTSDAPMPACYSHWRDLQCVDPANASDVGSESAPFRVVSLSPDSREYKPQRDDPNPHARWMDEFRRIPGCQKGMPYHTRLASQRFRAALTRTRDALIKERDRVGASSLFNLSRGQVDI